MSRRGKRAEHGAEADERWVISYADLVTLLFGFFLLLYATADANVVKMEALSRGLAAAFHVPIKDAPGGGSIFESGTGIVPGNNDSSLIERDLEFIQQLVRERSIEKGVLGQIVVNREEDRIVIRLADNLIFPSASADIRPEALPLLGIVAEALVQLDNEVRVEGHTDNVPVGTEKYPSNWELSSARATAVLRYLAEGAGVEPSRLFAAGYGEHRPIGANLTPEGRALNRRADIVVLYPPARIAPDGPLGAGSEGPAMPGQE
jgi:chemotaxis protein MotB